VAVMVVVVADVVVVVADVVVVVAADVGPGVGAGVVVGVDDAGHNFQPAAVTDLSDIQRNSLTSSP
jgi:hypothetical protein